VRAASELGLPVQIYRPALISTSRTGAGDENDVLVRLLSFMISHGIAVDSRNQLSVLPADIAAANIAAIFSGRRPPGGTLHVVVDEYYSIAELTRTIAREHGYPMAHMDIPSFISEMNRLCRPHEPLYPLLDFFNRSADKIAAMQLKRYRNDVYRATRDASAGSLPDPSLEETAACLVGFMQSRDLIPRPPSASHGRPASELSGPAATSRSATPRASA
jgi:thioester reductase-like protein